MTAATLLRTHLMRIAVFLGLLGVWSLWVPQTFGSEDFLQYYGAGNMVVRGQSHRLYDQPAFAAAQQAIAQASGRQLTAYWSLYPPTVAVAFAPLASLPYELAFRLWRFLQVACFLASVLILLRQMAATSATGITVLLGVAAFLPVWISLSFSQAAGLWLLILTAGMALHQRDRPIASGLVLSCLGLKPQFVVGVLVWLLVRRDRRAVSGLALGAAAQVALVTGVLGFDVWTDYLANLGSIAQILREHSFSAAFQHGVAAIVAARLGAGAGLLPLLVQAAVAVAAVYLASRTVGRDAGRSRLPDGQPLCTAARLEYSAVVLLALLLSPHVLTYDLSILVIPVAYLWLAVPEPRTSLDQAAGRLLYALVALSPLSMLAGVSFVALSMPLALALVAATAVRSRTGPAGEPCSPAHAVDDVRSG